MKIQEYRNALEQAKGKRNVIQQQLTTFKEKQEGLETRSRNIELAQVLIQRTAQETQEQLRFFVEDIVNMALQTCFPDEYEFKVEFEIKRGRTEATLKLFKNGFEIDPVNSSGGGLSDILSLGLRLAAWSLGNTRNVLILDESLKFLSRDLQPKAGEILKEISEKLNIQIILVTHSPALIERADKVFTVSLDKEVSIVS